MRFSEPKVNNRNWSHEVPDPTAEQQITVPSGDSDVTNTQNDKEVLILREVLRLIKGYMSKNENKGTPTDFTLALSGPAGACDGCKKRIAKLLDLCAGMAEAFFASGVQASLTITYRYANPAAHGANGGMHGWPTDEREGEWYMHTVYREAHGTK